MIQNNKQEIYQALLEGYQKTKRHAYGSFIGFIIWIAFAFLHGDFSKADAWITIFWITVCVWFCETQRLKQINLIKARKLGYNSKFNVSNGNY